HGEKDTEAEAAGCHAASGSTGHGSTGDGSTRCSRTSGGDAGAREHAPRSRTSAVEPASGRPQSASAMFQPLDSEEAAIPFDRVPYVPRDLRRVAIMAALMIVLILIAAFVVTRINP